MGAEVRRHSRVVDIDRLEGTDARWRVHVESNGEIYAIDCDIVVNAAGFYGAEISAMAGIGAPLAVLEHQYLVTGAVPELVENTEIFPLVRDPEIMFYLRRENDRLLFGNYGHEGRTVWENGAPDIFDSSLFAPDDEGIAEIAELAMAHVPLLGEVGIAEFVNGPITYTPDMNPLIGPAAGVEGFYQAVGVQIGITHAAAAGKVLTEMITGGDTEWDVWPWILAASETGPWLDPDALLHQHPGTGDVRASVWCPVPTSHVDLGPSGAADRATTHSLPELAGQIAGWERFLVRFRRVLPRHAQLPRRALARCRRRGVPSRTRRRRCDGSRRLHPLRDLRPRRSRLPRSHHLHPSSAGRGLVPAASERHGVERGDDWRSSTTTSCGSARPRSRA